MVLVLKMHHTDVITELQTVSKLAMLVIISAVKRTKTELSSLEVLLQKNVFAVLNWILKFNYLLRFYQTSNIIMSKKVEETVDFYMI